MKKPLKIVGIVFAVILTVLIVAAIGLYLAFKSFNIEDYKDDIGAWLKKNYDVTVETKGDMSLGFSNAAPSLKVEKFIFGKPTQFTAQNLGVSLGNVYAIYDAYKNQTDLDVDLRADVLNVDDTILKNVSLPIKVGKDIKTTSPMTAKIYNGDLRANARVAGKKIYIDGTISDVNIDQFVPSLKFPINVETKFSSRLGNAFTESLNGDVIFRSNGGEIDGSGVNLWGGDLLVNLIPGGSKTTKLLCMIAPFTVENGIAATDGIIINTGKVVVLGKGSINLNTQKVDFVFKPKPKDISLLNLATPINVTGDLANPKASLDKMGLAKKVGGLLAGAVNPAALLFTFSKFGSDVADDACFKQAQSEIPAEAKENK